MFVNYIEMFLNRNWRCDLFFFTTAGYEIERIFLDLKHISSETVLPLFQLKIALFTVYRLELIKPDATHVAATNSTLFDL